MDQSKRLIVHIGTHKTGTTSFQASLRANRRALIKQGFRPISAPKRVRGLISTERYNVGRFAQSFLRPGVGTVARLRRNFNPEDARDLERLRAKMLKRIRRASEPNVILSAEAFCFLRSAEEAADLGAFFEAAGRSVSVVLVLRNIDDWRESWVNQLRKFPPGFRRNRKLPDERRADGSWYFDVDAIKAFWSGFGPVATVDYDAARAPEGNLIPALYREMGVNPTGFQVEFERNQRVDLDED